MTQTTHADRRTQQREIHYHEIELVLDYGTRVYNGGALFVFMARKNMTDAIPPAIRDRIDGITLVMDPESQELRTAYKNRKALRDIRREKEALHAEVGSVA